MSSVNLKNLSVQELKKLVKYKNEEVEKLEQENEKETLILAYKVVRDRNSYYIKLVCENYTTDEDIMPSQDIHLVFRSKQDYKKISDINKLFKRYFGLEEMHLKTGKKFIIYYYLKEMIRQLKEYDPMVVLSDHVEAFYLEFEYISDFNTKGMELRVPPPPLIVVVDSDHEDHEEKKKHYEEVVSKNEKYYRKVRKVVRLSHRKILH